MERKIIITHNSQTGKGTFECPIVYKNFWSSKVLNSLNKKIEKSPEEHKNGSNRVQWSTEIWHRSITADSGPILIIDLTGDKEIITDIKKELDVIYDTCTFRYSRTNYCKITFQAFFSMLPNFICYIILFYSWFFFPKY